MKKILFCLMLCMLTSCASQRVTEPVFAKEVEGLVVDHQAHTKVQISVYKVGADLYAASEYMSNVKVKAVPFNDDLGIYTHYFVWRDRKYFFNY